jgi:hypothetical protein
MPKPKQRKSSTKQPEIVFDKGRGLSTEGQKFDPTSIINNVRQAVDSWRKLPNQNRLPKILLRLFCFRTVLIQYDNQTIFIYFIYE